MITAGDDFNDDVDSIEEVQLAIQSGRWIDVAKESAEARGMKAEPRYTRSGKHFAGMEGTRIEAIFAKQFTKCNNNCGHL